MKALSAGRVLVIGEIPFGEAMISTRYRGLGRDISQYRI
jgi:hypothetical protein